ncbi:MAG: hypothetical protein DCC58_21015, partial [Chloroflexi bacterium]
MPRSLPEEDHIATQKRLGQPTNCSVRRLSVALLAPLLLIASATLGSVARQPAPALAAPTCAPSLALATSGPVYADPGDVFGVPLSVTVVGAEVLQISVVYALGSTGGLSVAFNPGGHELAVAPPNSLPTTHSFSGVMIVSVPADSPTASYTITSILARATCQTVSSAIIGGSSPAQTLTVRVEAPTATATATATNTPSPTATLTPTP